MSSKGCGTQREVKGTVGSLSEYYDTKLPTVLVDIISEYYFIPWRKELPQRVLPIYTCNSLWEGFKKWTCCTAFHEGKQGDTLSCVKMYNHNITGGAPLGIEFCLGHADDYSLYIWENCGFVPGKMIKK